MTKKPILLCILDGWGIGDDADSHNSIARANLPNYKKLLEKYPHSQLETSGLAVGLPEGQMGNSEVGHMTIGAGRVIFQDLPRINNAIKDGSLAKNSELQKLISTLRHSEPLSCHSEPKAKDLFQTPEILRYAQDDRGEIEDDRGGIEDDKRRVCHIMGLLSDGGVHSHIDHIVYLANFLVKNNVKVLLHAFLDGRDVAQKSALNYLEKIKNIEIATIHGRYYAMDRDKNWNRIKLAYDAIAKGIGEKNSDAISTVNNSYKNSITDEFVLPTVLGNYQGIEDGDAMIFCNFRADRAREISETLLDNNFKEFETKKINFSHALALTEYSEKLNQFYKVLFPPIEIKNSLPEVLASNNLRQLRIAETEKYAHVTFFFSCGEEKEMAGEKRILVKSPAVATYDLKPEMSAFEIGDKLMAAIKSDEFDFIIVNYANPDMVGHSGMLDPSIKACEAIDKQLGMLADLILAKNGYMLISADHGNIECMIDENHQPHTSHTTNPVPFILIGNDVKSVKLENGALDDIAPTILHLMNIAKPQEMTGKNLIK